MKSKNEKGLFVVIEGIDHTGKETQSKILVKRLKRSGFKTSYFDFPQYKQRSAVFVEDYLTGEFGEATKLDPFVSNLFFALDRFSAKKAIKNSLNEGGGSSFKSLRFFRSCSSVGKA